MNGRCLVDTNVIIRLLSGDERSVKLFDQAESICIPAIVAGEMFYGAENSTKRQENMSNFSNFLSQYEVAEVDLEVAQAYGEVKAQLKKDGVNIPENDLWVAAIAIARQFVLLTFDSHFSKINGLQIIP
jgi:predicted nucleic acid-binding protein